MSEHNKRLHTVVFPELCVVLFKSFMNEPENTAEDDTGVVKDIVMPLLIMSMINYRGVIVLVVAKNFLPS